MYHRHHQNRNAIDERQRPDQPISHRRCWRGSQNHGIYSDRYVAFTDILGFGNIVRNSVQPSGQAVQLVGVLDRIAQLLV
jgi:hypothetical protein